MGTPQTIWIDGVERRIVNTRGGTAMSGSRDGWIYIKVSPDAESNVPVAEHSVPWDWFYRGQGSIRTGGHRFSHTGG